jgi:hypothetical protein
MGSRSSARNSDRWSAGQIKSCHCYRRYVCISSLVIPVGESRSADTTRADSPTSAALSQSHLLLSLPLTRLTRSPYSTSPLFISHFYDLQYPLVASDLSAATSPVHSGPPSTNVEVILRGDDVEGAFEGAKATVRGKVWARGPGVLAGMAEVDG